MILWNAWANTNNYIALFLRIVGIIIILNIININGECKLLVKFQYRFLAVNKTMRLYKTIGEI